MRPHNGYIDVRIPDLSPDGGPVRARTGRGGDFNMHGNWQLPWAIFRHFVDAIEASGDIVQAQSPDALNIHSGRRSRCRTGLMPPV